MNTFIRSIAVLLAALLVQAAGAQVISGKGFIPDENGTNLDDPQASKTAQQKVAPGTIIKDCAECPEMVVLPDRLDVNDTPLHPKEAKYAAPSSNKENCVLSLLKFSNCFGCAIAKKPSNKKKLNSFVFN